MDEVNRRVALIYEPFERLHLSEAAPIQTLPARVIA
jgi:hypothetical protein